MAILFVASLYGAYRPELLISQVAVEGNKTVSDFEIRQVVGQELSGKYWGLYPKRNALLFPQEEVVVAVAKNFPRLSTVRLERPNLRELKLVVTERRGEFLWCITNNNCYFADKTGFVFTPAPRFSSPLYFEFLSSSTSNPLGKYPIPTADFQKLVEAQKEFSAIIDQSLFAGQKVFRVVPAELRDWYFKVGQWEIRLDLDQDLSQVMSTLKAVLADPDFIKETQSHHLSLQYLDLRFAPKVVYRYNN